MKHHRIATLLMAAALLSFAGRAPASPPDGSPPPAPLADGRAAALLRAGNKAFKEGRFADAEKAYREAFEIKRGYDVAGNLAAAELAQGKLREAAGHFAFTVRHFPLTGDPALRDQMQLALDQCKKGVGAALVKLDLPGAVVRVDGEPVGEAPLLDPIYLEPGDHTISASLAGYAPAEQRIHAERGETVTVTLAPAPLPPPVQPRPPVVVVKRRPLAPGLVLGGVAVVGFATGAAFMGLSSRKRSDAASLGTSIFDAHRSCIPSAANYDSARCPALQSAVHADDTFHNVAVGSFIVGSVAAAGAAAYFLWPERRVPRAGLRVTPMVGSGDGGVLVSGSF